MTELYHIFGSYFVTYNLYKPLKAICLRPANLPTGFNQNCMVHIYYRLQVIGETQKYLFTNLKVDQIGGTDHFRSEGKYGHPGKGNGDVSYLALHRDVSPGRAPGLLQQDDKPPPERYRHGQREPACR